jgi:N-acetylmuramic acid 6-phosphate etherase
VNDLPVTERRHPRSKNLDELPTSSIVRLVVEDAIEGARAVLELVPQVAELAEVAARCLGRGGRLLYVGAGTSGRLGVLDASECPPTFGTDPEVVQGVMAGGTGALVRSKEGAEDDAGAGAQEMTRREVGENDLVVGISASGRTPFVIGALEEARRRGATTSGIAFVEEPALAAVSDHLVSIALGPEVVTGSTRLKAGTATKIVLNALSTACMVRRGHVYSNLMVNLQAGCEKLEGRALRITAELAGITEDAAASILAGAEGDLRVAIVMHRLSVSKEEADRRLAAAGGNLRQALGDATGSTGDVP